MYVASGIRTHARHGPRKLSVYIRMGSARITDKRIFLPLGFGRILLRHGPFDIQGGGGAWVFDLGQDIFFFRQNRSKIIFFAGPSGRIIIFFFS